MRYSHGFKQSRSLVRVGLAWLCFYFVFSGFGLAQSGFEQIPARWQVKAENLPYSTEYGDVEVGFYQACFLGAGRVLDSFSSEVFTAPGDPTRYCRVMYHGTYGDGQVNLQLTAYPMCDTGFTFSANDGDTSRYTGSCKKLRCQPASSTCWLSSSMAISSVPSSACILGCVTAQGITDTQERFTSGQPTWYYHISKARTTTTCATNTAANEVSCNASAPAVQDPCGLPDAASNPSCGGGAGCGPGYTMIANGACTANDSNAPCVAPSARDIHGVCVPYAGAGGGTGGGGTGAAGTGGSGGNSGSTGGAGGSGGAGSSTGGGGGGGSGGQGGGGGGGGTGGGGGSGGVGGAGGAGKEDVKCGTTGDLCQTKFQEYFDAVKDFFAGDPVLAADGKAEVLKSDAGGYEENKLTKGPVTDLSSLHLDTGGGMIGGGHSCPQSRQINFKGATVAISYQPLCDFSGYIRAVLLALCALVCARLVFGAWN